MSECTLGCADPGRCTLHCSRRVAPVQPLPAYHCQQCGACIGYVGRFFQRWLGRFAPHQCRPTERMIDVADLMKGMFERLSPQQQRAALEYTGSESHGASPAPSLPTREEIARVLRESIKVDAIFGFDAAADRILSLFAQPQEKKQGSVEPPPSP